MIINIIYFLSLKDILEEDLNIRWYFCNRLEFQGEISLF